METSPTPNHLTQERAQEISLQAGRVFTPRTPVSHRELFAGRWPEIQALVDAVGQVGLHVALYGERGVGKTSLANVIPVILEVFDEDTKRSTPRIVIRANAHGTDDFSSVWTKILDEITWEEDAPSLGFKPAPGKVRVRLRDVLGLGSSLSIDDVKMAITNLGDSVFVIDEFDRVPEKEVSRFTDLIKSLADTGSEATIVVVGVADTVEALIASHASIRRSLVEIHLRRMKPSELRDIIQKAEKQLGVVFEKSAGESIVMLSQGLPHWTHLIGQLSVRVAMSRLSGVITKEDVSSAMKQAVKAADHSISKAFDTATRSAQPGALYTHVLLACAIAAAQDADGGGYFQPVALVKPLTAILHRDSSVEISAFNKHLGEFCEDKRAVLQRDGSPRAYRYRFRDPLMLPYVLMYGISEGLIDSQDLSSFMGKIGDE